MRARKYILAGAAALAALPLVTLLPHTSSKPAFNDDCDDSIKNCRNPHQTGHQDKCWCFSCEGDTPPAVCTRNERDKLALFEAEASRRGTDVDFSKFPQQVRERLARLGIVPGDLQNDNQLQYANSNSGNVNAGSMNGNWNAYVNANMNSNGRPSYNSNSTMRTRNQNR